MISLAMATTQLSLTEPSQMEPRSYEREFERRILCKIDFVRNTNYFPRLCVCAWSTDVSCIEFKSLM
jgi:hypothetical protein